MPDINKINDQLLAVTRIVGNVVPLVGAISAIIELGKLVRPTEAKAAQEFDEAMAVLRNARVGLRTELDEFHRLFPMRADETNDTGE